MWSDWLVFCDCGFQSVCPLMEKDKRLMEASWWERLTEGKLGPVLMGGTMLSKFLIQFSVNGWGCVSSLLFNLGPNYGGDNEDNGSVQFSCSVMSNSLQPHGLQHARPLCPSTSPGVYSNSCPFSRWCHSTILSSIVPFSSHLQSFPASGAFPMSQFFVLGSQSIGVSASAPVFPMNIQYWFPLGWTSWISLQSKGLSR